MDKVIRVYNSGYNIVSGKTSFSGIIMFSNIDKDVKKTSCFPNAKVVFMEKCCPMFMNDILTDISFPVLEKVYFYKCNPTDVLYKTLKKRNIKLEIDSNYISEQQLSDSKYSFGINYRFLRQIRGYKVVEYGNKYTLDDILESYPILPNYGKNGLISLNWFPNGPFIIMMFILVIIYYLIIQNN